jgi:hypothetical protein
MLFCCMLQFAALAKKIKVNPLTVDTGDAQAAADQGKADK